MTARRVAQAGTAQTPDAMRTLLAHHLSALADYTQASILITADATHTGTAEIRAFFAKLMPQFPTLGTRFELDRMTVIEDLLFIAWHANTPTVKVSLGSDTFLVKQGKIHRQTFVGQLEPI
jgi:hypothetical protein